MLISKIIRKSFLQCLFFCIFSFGINAEEPEKAIMESSKELGIKLSPKALKTIGIQTITFKKSNTNTYTIPKSSLLFTKDKTGVYCLRQNWFKFVPVKVLSKGIDSYLVSSSELTSDDKLVTEGVALLRVSEMEAFSSEE